MREKHCIIIILLVLAVAISSRFVNIGTQGILIDETWVVPTTNFHFEEKNIYPKLFTYQEFQNLNPKIQEIITRIYHLHPLIQITAIRAVSDVHPPLFFFMNYYWSKWFGFKESTIRTPAAVYFIFTLFLFLAVLKKQDFDLKITIIALALLAASPIYLFFSNFARPYTLLLFLCLLSSFLCYKIIVSDFKRRIVYLYIFTAVGCLYTHYYGTLVVASQPIYLFVEACLINLDKNKLIRIVKSQLLILVIFSPWILIIILQILFRYPETKQGFQSINLYTIFDLFLTFSLGYSRSTIYSTINIITCVFQLLLFGKGFYYLYKKKAEISSRY